VALTTQDGRSAGVVSTPRTGRWIDDWRPEDPEFWERTGRRVARRNLVFSILAEHVGFSVWLLWSVVAVSLPAAGYDFSVDQLFWLVALPNLVGSFMRFPYTFAVPKFGGRNWTATSASLLLVPLGLLVACVGAADTPYWMFVVAAVTAGLGGGNFASSMANISFFYPQSRKGFALGLNAAGGNVGVSVVQLVVPAVITLGVGTHLAYAGLMWLPLVALAVAGAWFFMDNLTVARSSFRDQVVVTRRRHTWVMSLLYVGTFGSFIGYSAAFPLLISTQFPDVNGAHYAFLGALVGSLTRPLGGWFADRLGGSRVTFWNFAVMGLGVLAVSWSLSVGSFAAFLASFLLLFVTTGIGNGSTFRMIPAIFRSQALAEVPVEDEDAQAAALVVSRRESAAVLGFTSAVGAVGGFFIPRAFGISIAHTGEVGAALGGFLGFYLLCLGVTWWYYLRTRVLVSRVPSLAPAQV
jgi:MFS transporter, NNP family, nitrate/nitrite transporter